MMTKRENTHWTIMKNRETQMKNYEEKRKNNEECWKREEKKQWTMMKNSGKIRTHDEK